MKEGFDPVYTRENGTVLFITEQFYASFVKAKRFQMALEVVTMEEELVLWRRNVY